ncbi:PREDICTED: M-phase phosphoprotein 6 [Dufourea novaeangliae]|uniref:M-phase phosphoprotein 6 n=1 Tax=Dufourea novaeangliae TaxID=178035 RepID=A0A154PSI4_DUFNO|nr:PREDICTED: M-phase phosphoprotein 6 [Dufourea novaeangliae]KZC14294.1 M-phase phosphoprotein 6 [Dufourea novaeangliae]
MNSSKAKLSKSILEMKFMKRTKEKVEKQQFQEEGEEYFGNEVTKRMKKESERFIIEPSYIFCEKLIDGRVSYQGMNPEVEKLMEAEEKNKCVLLDIKNDTDISDEQMVEHWKGLRTKIKSKYTNVEQIPKSNTKCESVPKKPKYLKPQD